MYKDHTKQTYTKTLTSPVTSDEKKTAVLFRIATHEILCELTHAVFPPPRRRTQELEELMESDEGKIRFLCEQVVPKGTTRTLVRTGDCFLPAPLMAIVSQAPKQGVAIPLSQVLWGLAADRVTSRKYWGSLLTLKPGADGSVTLTNNALGDAVHDILTERGHFPERVQNAHFANLKAALLAYLS